MSALNRRRVLRTKDTEDQRWARRLSGIDTATIELLWSPEDGHPVPRCHGVIPSRAARHLTSVTRDDCDGDEIAEMASERVVVALVLAHGHLDHGEPFRRDHDVVRGPPETGLHERRSGQRGDVEHTAGAAHPLQGPAHRGVGELDDKADVGSFLAHPHGDLEGDELVGLDADDRDGPGQTRFGETVSHVGAAVNVGNSPALDDPGQAEVGVVVDDHDGHPAQVQLLDRPEPDSSQPAHDDMAVGPLGAMFGPVCRRSLPDLTGLRRHRSWRRPQDCLVLKWLVG